MSIPKIYTYNPKKSTTSFEFYILCKGLNSGKPLEKPCPNSFVIACNTQAEKDYYFTLIFGLWKAKQFYSLHVGSVIPFIRINEFKNLLKIQSEKIQNVKNDFLNSVQQFNNIELLEKNYKKNILLISEAKKAILIQYFK